MRLDAKTKLDDLLQHYPFLLNFLVDLSPKFSKLKSPVMRKTVGKIATLQQVAGFGGTPLAELLEKIRDEIKRVTREDVDLETSAEAPEPLAGREARLEALKDIIRELHTGGNLEEQKQRFAKLVKDTSPAEIAEMEQALMNEGMPEDEVKRLCDVHVQVFKESLEEKPLPSSVPGHPLHTLIEENRALAGLLTGWKDLLGRVEAVAGEVNFRTIKGELRDLWQKLAEVEKHYLKKENQLFPLLEAKGVSGPSKVMWAIHDDIRAQLREFRQLLSEENAGETVKLGRKLGDAMADMIYKEEKILFPMSLETLSESDWARAKRGEEEIGYAWVKAGTEWKPSVMVEEIPALGQGRKSFGRIELDTGALTPEQVNLLLKALPVDISFVDENDTVLYYSATTDRIFPRSAAVIGRKVQNCHPPASVHIVNRILEAFKSGERDVAEFWIELRGKFILIRYFAVRDANRMYKGCLEVSQDATAIRGLKGEQRLLDWE